MQAAVFGQINSSRRAIVWKLDRNLFSICPSARIASERGPRVRAGREKGALALCNFGRLASLPVILVSRVTPDRADPFEERDLKLRFGARSSAGVDFHPVRRWPCSLGPRYFFMYKVEPQSIMHSVRIVHSLFTTTLQGECRGRLRLRLFESSFMTPSVAKGLLAALESFAESEICNSLSFFR